MNLVDKPWPANTPVAASASIVGPNGGRWVAVAEAVEVDNILLPPVNNTVPNLHSFSTGLCSRFEAPGTSECDSRGWI